jgi:hypothetical protein
MFVTALLAATLAAPVPKEKAKGDFWPRRVGDKWVYERGDLTPLFGPGWSRVPVTRCLPPG